MPASTKARPATLSPERFFSIDWAKCATEASLVAAIIPWNTVYLERAFAELGRQGRDVRPGLAKHVAPLGWEHIGLTGDYVWSSVDQPAGGSFRPLRRRDSMLAA